MKTLSQFLTEARVAENMGVSAVAGIRDGESPPVFAGKRVFKVNSKSYTKLLRGPKKPKHSFSRYIEDTELEAEIREYAKNNPDADIMVQDGDNGGIVYLKRVNEGYELLGELMDIGTARKKKVSSERESPPGMSGWINKNREKYHSEYGNEKGDHKLYSAAWSVFAKRKKKGGNIDYYSDSEK